MITQKKVNVWKCIKLMNENVWIMNINECMNENKCTNKMNGCMKINGQMEINARMKLLSFERVSKMINTQKVVLSI